jgi:hypothetical protein
MIKRASVLASLPVEEREEVERLEARKRLSAASEARLSELWNRAFDAHAQRQQARKERLERIRRGEEDAWQDQGHEAQEP